MMAKRLRDLTALYGIYILAAILASLLKWVLGRGENGYTSYENYIIFRNAFSHLISGQNIYSAFPAEQWDLFKYSPAFALFMAPFSLMPDWLGLCCWNLLNAIPMLLALLALPLSWEKKRFVAWFVFLELLTSMQSSQSNGLMTGLMLWAWVGLERRQAWLFGLCAASAIFVKIFGLFCLLPALMYRERLQAYAWTLLCCLLLALLPALATGPTQLIQVYQWWAALLQSDQAVSLGISVQGWLFHWFGWEPSKSLVALSGLGLMSIATLHPLFRQGFTAHFSLPHRTLAWAALLIWVVIFNHKAESPTYVIAMTGVGLCYVYGSGQKWEFYLLLCTFLLVSLSPTDIFPRSLREQFIQPYVLKALPCIIVWGLALFRLFQNKHIHE